MGWNETIQAMNAAQTDTAENGGAVRPLMLTKEQVQLLDEMLRDDILNDPHKWEETLALRALYNRVQIMVKGW